MQIPKVANLRDKRAMLNAKMDAAPAANPKLQGKVDAINSKIQGVRAMPNKGVEAMPRVGPNTGGGLRPQPTGDGRTAPMGDGRTNPNPQWQAWHPQQPGAGVMPMNGSDEVTKALALAAANGAAPGQAPIPGMAPQNKFGFDAFSEPHAGAVRPIAPGSYMPPPPQAAPIASGGMSPMQNPQHWGMPQFQGMTPYRSQTRSPGIGMDGRPLKY